VFSSLLLHSSATGGEADWLLSTDDNELRSGQCRFLCEAERYFITKVITCKKIIHYTEIMLSIVILSVAYLG
jgi:hypothetical protein